ncbi:hypothetical protein GGI35DRAFT_441479 [Trichoderma velutinum]
MFASLWSFLGWKEEEPVPVIQHESYPPVTFVGVRIPADGSPIHLLPLTTISDSSATDSFLLHVPDLRPYWLSADAWRMRDIHRFDLQKDGGIPISHHLQQTKDFKTLLILSRFLSWEQRLHLQQRHLLPQQRFFVRQYNQYHCCLGAYYVFYSFAGEDLPINKFVPRWIEDNNHPDLPHYYRGDVFLVKISPDEFGQDGRAAYEDIDPLFLKFLKDSAARSKAPRPLLYVPLEERLGGPSTSQYK